MSSKTVEIADIGAVSLYKRRGVKHLRLSVNREHVRVTMPTWAPYKLGIDFAVSKADWIRRHRQEPVFFRDGQPVGKQRALRFVPTTNKVPSSRQNDSIVKVTVPVGDTETSPTVQAKARAAIVRALRQEAEDILPGRLRQLAEIHGFSFRSVRIRKLKGRWGSCSTHKDITLNCFLMQLPWQLIDYVLLHELMHTRIMAHGRPFWDALNEYVPDLPTKRKAMRIHRPDF